MTKVLYASTDGNGGWVGGLQQLRGRGESDPNQTVNVHKNCMRVEMSVHPTNNFFTA